MAYRIYIGGFEVDEKDIDGFDGIKVVKTLSDTYWGYWNEDGIGFGTDTNTKVVIRDEHASSYIKKIFDRDSFTAEIPIKIINEDTGQKVDLLIDFSDYEEIDCCFVGVSFRGKGGGSLLRSRERVEYPLQLTENLSVPIRDLPSQVDFSITDEVYTAGATLNHSIPLNVGENSFDSGTPNNVSVSESRQFITFSVNDCVQIEGSVRVLVSSVDEGTFKAFLRLNSTVIELGEYPIDSTLTEQTVTISEELNVSVADQLFLYVESDLLPTSFQFAYDNSSSGISVLRCGDTEIEYKTIKTISVRNAFDTIVRNSTNQTSVLSKYIFDDCLFDGYLTNNEGLQGIVSTINVSLFKLFEELSNKYPASIDINGNNVSVLSRCSFMTCQQPYKIEPVEVARAVNTDLLYSNIKVGYNNWKSESKFGSLEYNSTRDYETAYSISSNSLSLLNDWSSSSSIISEQIRKKREKDEIHWIMGIDGVAETNEYIEADVYQSDRAINLRITPVRNLNRWRKFILSNLKFASGTGNYDFSSTDSLDCDCIEEGLEIDESQDINSESIIGKFIYNIELESCGTDVSRLRGCVSFPYCGKTKIGFIKTVEYSISQSQSEIIKLQVVELV